MKIRIAYQPDEEKKAGTVAAVIGQLLGSVRINASDLHKPYRHIYIATRRAEKISGKETDLEERSK